jgi:hypothetical protein
MLQWSKMGQAYPLTNGIAILVHGHRLEALAHLVYTRAHVSRVSTPVLADLQVMYDL